MRSYSLLLPAFWTGPTGKAITAAGKDARILATYLLTCEHSNMIGLYRLPLLYAAEETGMKRREVLQALEQLKISDFAVYDHETEFVWVLEMARFQLGLLPSERIKEGDKRAKGAARLYKQITSNPFLGPFHGRYSEVLGLPLRRDFLSERKHLLSPLVEASDPLTWGYDPVPDPVPVRKGEVGETKTLSLPSAELTSEQIRDQWNVIPGVKPCKEIGETIRERIQARMKKHSQPEWWDTFFRRVQASDFLCGRTNGSRGSFHASLTWILAPKNFDKMLAGDYDTVSSNDHGASSTCAKRIQRPGDRFLRPCGQPVSPGSRPTEPRCAEHVAGITPTQREVHAYN